MYWRLAAKKAQRCGGGNVSTMCCRFATRIGEVEFKSEKFQDDENLPETIVVAFETDGSEQDWLYFEYILSDCEGTTRPEGA
jgi:hypothetical protein